MVRKVKELDSTRLTKSGLMVGLGETFDELKSTINEIKKVDVDILTLGQYLKPTKDNLDVARYYTPEEFDTLKDFGLDIGFPFVFSGPMIRSSYLADIIFEKTAIHNELKLSI